MVVVVRVLVRVLVLVLLSAIALADKRGDLAGESEGRAGEMEMAVREGRSAPAPSCMMASNLALSRPPVTPVKSKSNSRGD
jgi:hypothetical protein